jgi:hypothetical protein
MGVECVSVSSGVGLRAEPIDSAIEKWGLCTPKRTPKLNFIRVLKTASRSVSRSHMERDTLRERRHSL